METMGKVLKTALQNYISALSVLKLESGSTSKNKTGQYIGDVDASASSSSATLLSASTSANNASGGGGGGGGGSGSHFLSSLGQGSGIAGSIPTTNDGKSAHTNFSLGKRAKYSCEYRKSAAPIIAHSISGSKLPWEALFRSSQKLLVDMATFEYLFCVDFWKGDSQIFRDVFAQTVTSDG